jgi:hypothetical protein
MLVHEQRLTALKLQLTMLTYGILDAHSQICGILSGNSNRILNAHTLLRLESNVGGLAHRKNWHPARQSLHTGGFLLAATLEGLPDTIGPMSASKKHLKKKHLQCLSCNAL